MSQAPRPILSLVKRAEPPEIVSRRAERVRQGGPLEALPAALVAAELACSPGWQPYPAGPGLVRLYHFPVVADAAAFAVFAADLLAGLGVTPDLELFGPTVSVRVFTLYGVGEISAIDFDLAALLDGRGEAAR